MLNTISIAALLALYIFLASPVIALVGSLLSLAWPIVPFVLALLVFSYHEQNKESKHND
jgi:hypothetical protein